MNKSNVGASTNSSQIVMDVIVNGIAFLFAVFITEAIGSQRELTAYLVVWGCYVLVYVLSNKEARVYNVTTFYYTDRIVWNITRSVLLAAVSTSALMFYVGQSAVNRKFFLCYIGASYFFAVVANLGYHKLSRLTNNSYVPRVLFVGEISGFERFRYFMKKTNMHVTEVGYVAEGAGPTNGYLGMLDNLEHMIREYSVDQVFFMQEAENAEEQQKYITLCTEMGVTVKVIVNYYRPDHADSYVSSIGTYPVLTYHTISLNSYDTLLKRTVDIAGSLVGILLSSPLMLLAAIAIKLDSPGPILFRQTRIGMNGRAFKILKFRTMYIDAEERKKELMAQNEVQSGLMFKMKDDPRITRVGKFLRKASIDELPQFFNVLFGQMSLVGTRPPTLDEVEQYNRKHWRRISIKPGITGMWQVSGRSAITDFDEVVRLDTSYIDGWNLFKDVKIICMTVAMIFVHRGAY